MLLKRTHQRALKWAIGFLALLVLILISLPFVIQLEIERALTRLGTEQVSVKNVDFNPFVGRLLLANILAQALWILQNVLPSTLRQADTSYYRAFSLNRLNKFQHVMRRGLKWSPLYSKMNGCDSLANVSSKLFNDQFTLSSKLQH